MNIFPPPVCGGATASLHGRTARGGHGSSKVSLWPVVSYPSTPCKRPLLKRFYGCLRGARPEGWWPEAVFYPVAHPTPDASQLEWDVQ
jgi:hypothetical protein